ncbi:MAG: hypothetical protein ABEL76_01490 [Bradymonadaceae bacterium]
MPELPAGFDFVSVGAIFLLIALGAAAAYQYREQLADMIRRRRLVAFLLGVVGISVLSTLGVYVFEHAANDQIDTPFQAVWAISIFLLSGLEVQIETVGGKFFAFLAIATGPLALAVVTALLASNIIIEHLEAGVPATIDEHFVVINWNERARHVIRELRDPVLVKDNDIRPIVVIADPEDVTESERKGNQAFAQQEGIDEIYFTLGDTTKNDVLRSGKVTEARSILLLSDPETEGTQDERMLRTIFSLKQIARSEGLDDLHVVAELESPANRVIVEEMKRDFPGLLEIVLQPEIGSLLLSQSVYNPGLSSFFRGLMTFSGDTNEIYRQSIPAEAVGKPFDAVASEVIDRSDDSVIPVGVRRWVDGTPTAVCNPTPEDDVWELKEGDELLLIAYEDPQDELLDEDTVG